LACQANDNVTAVAVEVLKSYDDPDATVRDDGNAADG
jgi:hypothetical protein